MNSDTPNDAPVGADADGPVATPEKVKEQVFAPEATTNELDSARERAAEARAKSAANSAGRAVQGGIAGVLTVGGLASGVLAAWLAMHPQEGSSSLEAVSASLPAVSSNSAVEASIDSGQAGSSPMLDASAPLEMLVKFKDADQLAKLRALHATSPDQAEAKMHELLAKARPAASAKLKGFTSGGEVILEWAPAAPGEDPYKRADAVAKALSGVEGVVDYAEPNVAVQAFGADEGAITP